MLPASSVGIVTARDDLTIGFNEAEVLTRAERFRDMAPEDARREFNLGKDARDWKVQLAQADLRAQSGLANRLRRISYRPLDRRATVYTGRTRGFICMPRAEIMSHLGEASLSLASVRQLGGDDWRHVLVSRGLQDDNYISNVTRERGYAFPLWLSHSGESAQPNLSTAFTNRLANT